MSPPLTVVVKEAADHILVAPQGSIYFDTIDPLRDVLLLLVARERPRIVIDLSGVPVCDSSGLNLLVRTRSTCTRRGGWLRLASARPDVTRVLELTNLTRILPPFDTVDEAVHMP